MGAFDKDKEIGRTLDSTFDKGEEFFLLGARVEAGPVTEYGQSRKAVMTVVPLAGLDNQDPFEVNTLASSIADKLESLDAAEVPCVVCWTTAWSRAYKTDATVLQHVRDCTEDEKARLTVPF